jgi:flagellar hook-associated protein 2
MATDYLSKLNVGSGLNTAEIIDAIVAAEQVPAEKLINDKVEQRTLSISALAEVKSSLSSFQKTLSIIDGTTGLIGSSGNSAIDILVTDASLATAASYDVEVDTLATSQTLVFDGFTSADQSLGAGSLVINYGTWSAGTFTKNPNTTAHTLTILDGSDTLEDIVSAVNALDVGITASIIETDTDQFSFVLKSETGSDNALSITATETVSSTGLANLNYTAYDSSVEVIAASDAMFSLDGVDITRESNMITDVIDGVTLTLSDVTSSAVNVKTTFDTATAYVAMSSLVDAINSLNTVLYDVSERGLNGGKSGPLVNDTIIRGLISDIKSITTDAIYGYGNDEYYIANYGVATQRDGSLKLDYDDFVDAFEEDPDAFAFITQNRITASESTVVGTVFSDDWTGGNYSLTVDGDGIATLDGATMTTSGTLYFGASNSTDGLSLSIGSSVTSATVYMGRSVVSLLDNIAETLLESGNDLDEKVTNYNSDLDDYAIRLSTLEDKMAQMRARYVDKFTAMEIASETMKKTLSGLTSMMDAWSNNMKN